MISHTYQNAPLVEMVAELRWALTPLKVVPNGAIDPFYNSILTSLTKQLANRGYAVVQSRVPREVPIELIPHQVTTQFRTAPNAWPLFQLGPGIFTINITADYSGWNASFRSVVLLGVEALIESHPSITNNPFIEIKLSAIDVFSKVHDYENYSQFASKYLNLKMILPDTVIANFSINGSIDYTNSQTVFDLRDPPNSIANITIQQGKHKDADALILNTSVATKSGRFTAVDPVLDWLDSAHRTHHNLFEALVTHNLRQVLDRKAT